MQPQLLIEPLIPDLLIAERWEFIELDSAEAQCDFGERHLTSFSESIAKKAFKRALELYPTYARAHNGLGWACLTRFYIGLVVYKDDIDAWKDAIPAFSSAIALDPTYYEAYLGRARALDLLRRSDEAIRDYKHAISINPDSAESYAGLARIYERQGLYEEAMEALLHMMKIKAVRTVIPDRAVPNYIGDSSFHERFSDCLELARLLVKMGRYEEAIDEFNSVLILLPGDCHVVFSLGLAYMAAQDRQGAVEQHRALLEAADESEDEFSKADCTRYAEDLIRRVEHSRVE